MQRLSVKRSKRMRRDREFSHAFARLDFFGFSYYADGMRCLMLMLVLLMPLTSAGAELRVASLHPLLSEMARRVGGEHVEVVDLFPRNGELHRFEPTVHELASAVNCRFVLACGKGVEPYLTALRESLASTPSQVLELGDAVPDVMTPDGSAVDPHWWNAPENMKRAAISLTLALVQAMPQRAEAIWSRLAQYAQSMDALTREAHLALATVPQEQRALATAHAAMCHFCAAFRLQPLVVQGVAAESEGDLRSVAKLIRDLRSRGVRCVYSEMREAPRFLQNVAESAGAELGVLIMDGVAPEQPSYETIFRSNLCAVCKSLLPVPGDSR